MGEPDYQERLRLLRARFSAEQLLSALVDHLYEVGNLGVALDAVEAVQP